MLNQLLPRSFYETSELPSKCDEGNSIMPSPLRQKATFQLQYQVNKKEKREGDGAGVRVTSKKSKSKSNKHLPSRELNGMIYIYI